MFIPSALGQLPAPGLIGKSGDYFLAGSKALATSPKTIFN